MNRLAAPIATLLALAVALPASAPAAESYAVLAVADPPAGPDADLAELAHQLRAAARERVGGVLDAPVLRARLAPQEGGATLPELERAYQGAMATLQRDDPAGARNALRGIVDELERLPESAETYRQWTRALAQLAYLERYLKNPAVTAAALETLASTDPGLVLSERDFPPSFRREFEDVRRRVGARPRAQLTLAASGQPVTAYLNGREMGTTPLSFLVPAGRYRVGGAAGALRVPTVRVQLGGEERAVLLDSALAEAVRPQAGPGLALREPDRAAGLVRAGAWLGATRAVGVSTVREADAPFLEGSLLDVARGTTLRAGRVRMAGGSVPAPQIGALAAFLLTGQPVRDVKDVSPAPPPAAEPVLLPPPSAASAPLAKTLSVPPPPRSGPLALRPEAGAQHASTGTRRPWLGPAAYVSASLALGLAGVATWQGVAASDRSREADALILPGGLFVPGADKPTFDRKVASADSARRNAYLAAGGAVLFAATAGVLGYLAYNDRGEPVVRF